MNKCGNLEVDALLCCEMCTCGCRYDSWAGRYRTAFWWEEVPAAWRWWKTTLCHSAEWRILAPVWQSTSQRSDCACRHARYAVKLSFNQVGYHGSTQYRVIVPGLCQRTAVWHIGQQPQLMCRWHTIRWPVTCQAPHAASATELRQQLQWLPVCQRITYKLAVITYKTRSAGTLAYLSHLVHDYRPACTLRSSDILLLSVPRIALVLSPSASSLLQSESDCHMTVDLPSFSALLNVT